MSEIGTFVETWDTLLNHFCSRDDLRLAMGEPNIVGDFVYATDAHSWIKVPFQPSFRHYKNDLTPPDFKGASKDWKFIEPTVISKKSIESALSKFELKPDWRPCKECNGNGVVECKCCGNASDCENCDGTGSIDDYTVPEIYYNGYEEDLAIKVLDNLVAPFQIGRLIRAMDFLKAESISLFTNEKYKGLVFRHGEIEIVISPLSKYAEEGKMKVTNLEI